MISLTNREHYDIRLPTITVNRDCNSDLVPVNEKSPIGYRRAVYRLATYFRREFGYDFVQYTPDGTDTESHKDDRAYLFLGACGLEAPRTPVRIHAFGAVRFLMRDWGMALAWVWLHPFERRRGHLTTAWPMFEQIHGDFTVEPPLSTAMQQFLQTVESTYRHEII